MCESNSSVRGFGFKCLRGIEILVCGSVVGVVCLVICGYLFKGLSCWVIGDHGVNLECWGLVEDLIYRWMFFH